MLISFSMFSLKCVILMLLVTTSREFCHLSCFVEEWDRMSKTGCHNILVTPVIFWLQFFPLRFSWWKVLLFKTKILLKNSWERGVLLDIFFSISLYYLTEEMKKRQGEMPNFFFDAVFFLQSVIFYNNYNICFSRRNKQC